MKNKMRGKTVLCGAAALCCAVVLCAIYTDSIRLGGQSGLFLPGAGSFYAAITEYCQPMVLHVSAATSDSIKEKENQIAQKKKEKETLKNGLSNLQEIKAGLETQKANLKNYVRQLDSNLEQIEQNIAELNNQIDVKENEIHQTEEELVQAQERENNQQISLGAHIRMVYETRTPNLIEMLLDAGSFGAFLNKADYVEKMVDYDHQLWQSYKEIREYVELCKEELELEKEILDETKANVETEQKNLEELIEQKNRDIIAYDTDINNKEKAIREFEQEIKAEEEEIKLLEAAVAEEKRKLLESSRLKYDGGVFKFPLETYTRISDEYGMRMHPTLGIEQFHNGVDFASPKGTAIYAAYDGKVVAATYSATMGNYVMIDHGDELYTIYMHASALYVKKGDTVVRGDTIAAVGSTGRSTGNHLHFSVRLNGSYVSPWNYLSE